MSSIAVNVSDRSSPLPKPKPKTKHTPVIRFSAVQSCYEAPAEDEALVADLKQIRSEETRVYAMSDQFIALTRVHNETANSIESAKNAIRDLKLQIHQNQTAAERRQQSLSVLEAELAALTAHQRELGQSRTALKSEISSLKSTLTQTVDTLERAYEARPEDDAKLRRAFTEVADRHHAQKVIVDRLKSKYDMYDRQISELHAEEQGAEREREALKASQQRLDHQLTKLHGRALKASTIINEPCDELVVETSLVEQNENDAEQLTSLLQSTLESEIEEEIERATNRLDTIRQTVAQRTTVLRDRQAAIRQKQIALVTKKPTTTVAGSSAASRVGHMEARVAHGVIAGVFDKLKKRQEALDTENSDLDGLQDQFERKREKSERAWRASTAAIGELKDDLNALQKTLVDIAREEVKVDVCRQQIADNRARITRIELQNATAAGKLSTEQKWVGEIKELKATLAEKQARGEEVAAKVKGRREEIAAFERVAGEADARNARIGAEAAEIDGEVTKICQKLGELTKSIAQTYDKNCLARILPHDSAPA
jgi:DNA repair exonuclease SbcCD ATPase subunit